MKPKYYVLELDTDGYVRVLEVTREFTPEGGERGVAYHRAGAASCITSGWLDDNKAKFYGRLDTVLLTQERIDNAEPIEPVHE